MLEKMNERFKVEWIALGEGLCGFYDEDDPEDVELLRFDVYAMGEDGEWEEVEDGSYCTMMPCSSSPELQERALEYLLREVTQDAPYLKRTCERLSWINPDWFA